jgi:radical SAM protein (TIGR01212 family)
MGSGEFAEKYCGDISAQLERAKARVKAKNKDGKYIAYFQSFTNTYAPIDYLRKIYLEAINPFEIVGLAIATRPDCLSEDVIRLLKEINEIKPIWVELGLQTADDSVAEYIRRGYKTEVFCNSVKRLKAAGIETVAHIIIGLPNDNPVISAKLISDLGVDGVKFHLLHILKGTDLEQEYLKGNIKPLTLEEYTQTLKKCLSVLREDIIIHRLTGDGDKRRLVAPLWSGDKKTVLNYINKALKNI